MDRMKMNGKLENEPLPQNAVRDDKGNVSKTKLQIK